MPLRPFTSFAAFLWVGALATPALALSPYFDALRFVSPLGSAANTPYTTSQQWDSALDEWVAVSPAAGEGNFLQPGNPTPLPTPSLTVNGNINDTPYLFNGGSITADLYNYGGPDGATLPPPASNRTDARIFIQIATTTGGTGPASNPTGLGSNITPGSLRLIFNDTTYATLAANPVLLDSRPNAAGFGFMFQGTVFTPNAEQWLYEFVIPGWTGDFSLQFDVQPHAVFEALRVDTQLFAPAAPTVPGDYNGDGTVNAADYTVWADNFGRTGTNLPGDGNNSGSVDAADYTVWADNFGRGTPPGPLSIPEPAAVTVLLPAIILLARRHRSAKVSNLNSQN